MAAVITPEMYVELCAHGERLAACRECRDTDPGLAEILGEVEKFVRRFVVLSDAQAVAVTLWVSMSHSAQAFEIVPYLHIHSPEKRSGKTRLLDVLSVLVARPMLAADLSSSVLFRVMDERKPTLLMDEVDAIFGGRGERAEELRGLLNAGFKRGGLAWRIETTGKQHEPRGFDVFGPKALAGIGKVSETIADRSIPVEMARQVRSQAVERFRMRGKLEETGDLRDWMGAWADDAGDRLALARPSLPDELHDRAQDIWEPLLAIADRAGGDWPFRARDAARNLHSVLDDDADASVGVLGLQHIRELFEEHSGEVALSTVAILNGMCENDAGPWARWWSVETDGQIRSSATGLARLLRPYGIRSTTVKVGGTASKGYRRESFEDAWDRYLSRLEVTEGTEVTLQAAPTSGVTSVSSVTSTRQTSADPDGCVRCDRYGTDHSGRHIPACEAATDAS